MDVLEANYGSHLMVAATIRFLLIIYGIIHDSNFSVPFTDLDYWIFTDAARHVTLSESPYFRSTYRYSPIVAYLSIPNILFHPVFGKILFCMADLCVGLLIRKIVAFNFSESVKKSDVQKTTDKSLQKACNISMLLWLYNPLVLTVAARGNCDSLAVLSILSTIYFLQTNTVLAGLLNGFSIHFRLFPIIYSLAYYLYLSNFAYYSTNVRLRKPKPRFVDFFLPNWRQLTFVSTTVLSLTFISVVFYKLYGPTFLYETYMYHVVRKDIRHNFSLFFYNQYLSFDMSDGQTWQTVATALPRVFLLIALSFRYALNRFSFNFALLTLTIVMVTYNTVVTSQYFVWVWAILPLCAWQIDLKPKTVVCLIGLWAFAKGAWLLPAYLLEFCGYQSFFFIWMECIAFFCANVTILSRLIGAFNKNR